MARISVAIRPLDPALSLAPIAGACRKVAGDRICVATAGPLAGVVALVCLTSTDGTEFSSPGEVVNTVASDRGSLHTIQLLEPAPKAWERAALAAIRAAGNAGLRLSADAPPT